MAPGSVNRCSKYLVTLCQVPRLKSARCSCVSLTRACPESIRSRVLASPRPKITDSASLSPCDRTQLQLLMLPLCLSPTWLAVARSGDLAADSLSSLSSYAVHSAERDSNSCEHARRARTLTVPKAKHSPGLEVRL